MGSNLFQPVLTGQISLFLPRRRLCVNLENDHRPGDEEEAFLFLPVALVVWHRSVVEVHPIITRFGCTVDTFFCSLGLGPLNTTWERCEAALTAVRSCHTNNFLFYV